MLAGKNLIDYTNLFSPYDFKKNDDIILSYFKNDRSTYDIFKFKDSDTIKIKWNQWNQKLFYYRNSRKRSNE